MGGAFDVMQPSLPARTDAYLAAIVESSVDAIKAKTLDGTIVFWNQACERMYGYSPEEAIGRNVSFVMAPERPNELTEILDRIAAGERIEHYETERVRKDGTRLDVSISVSPVRDEHGTVVGAATIARDITERKRVEQGQRLLAAASRLFAEARLDPEAVLEGLCAAATEAVAESCMVSLLGEDGATLHPAAVCDRDPALGELQRRLLTEHPVRVGEGFAGRVVASGSPMLVPVVEPDAFRATMVPDHQPHLERLQVRSLLGVPLRAYGRTLGALVLVRHRVGRPFAEADLGIMQELAERAAMALDAARVYAEEQRSRHEAERLAAITRELGRTLSTQVVLDAVVDASAELLTAPVTGVFLLDASQQHFDLVAGRGFPVGHAAHRLPHAGSVAGRVVASGKAELVHDVRTGPATVLPALISGTAIGCLLVAPIGTPEQPLGVLAAYAPTPGAFGPRDADLLTVFADAAGAAIANARLYEESQRAVRTREEFLHVAAHELRGPITGLRGFAQMAVRQLDRPDGADPDRLRTALVRVVEQSRRLTDLVERLLDVTRLAAGRLELERHEVDLTALARETVEAVRVRYSDRIFRLHTPRPVLVDADAVRMGQVLANLLDNAAKFSPAGSPIDVEVSADGGDARVMVRDRGPGVPEAARERIFERFEQAHPERHYAGLGLGLYISRQLAELHGGAITHEPPPDGGARFVVRLPLAVSLSRAPAGHGPVLVVDDDDTIRALVAEALTDEGYETLEANDGTVALELVQDHTPRLILLDMRMPVMNGWEFAAAYRRMPGPHAPIVVITAGAEASVKARDIGADGYVAKPFELADLVKVVAAHAG